MTRVVTRVKRVYYGIVQVITLGLIQDKKVLLRLDLDAPLGKVTGYRLQVTDDFRLKAGLPTLKLCLEHASEVIIMGHIGRPEGKEVPELSVEPIYGWLKEQGFGTELDKGKLKLLENLRFEPGEEDCDLEYAKELAKLGDVFVNEAFAAHHPAASTTVLLTLLPHAAGLRFAEEVRVLEGVRENPKRPLVVIIGGAKVEDKLPAVEAMAKIATNVLVGGKIAREFSQGHWPYKHNIVVAELNNGGTDVTGETISDWKEIIEGAKMIVWNGPLGKVEDPKNDQTKQLAEILINSEAETIIGGGDTVGYLEKLGLLDKFVYPESSRRAFVSTGGGAMLEFLEKGTLPTIEALS